MLAEAKKGRDSRYQVVEEVATGRITLTPINRAIPDGAEPLSGDELQAILDDDYLNIAFQAANEYTQARFGRDYDRFDRGSVQSGLAKQAAIARVYPWAAAKDDQYKELVFDAYRREMPDVVEEAGASNFDELTDAAYAAMGRETRDQFDALPDDLQLTYHQGDLEYPKAEAMWRCDSEPEPECVQGRR